MTEAQRNEAWTKQALAHKDGQGRPIEQQEATFKSVGEKDETGQVIIPDNVGDKADYAFTGKHALKKSSVQSPFESAQVVSVFNGF